MKNKEIKKYLNKMIWLFPYNIQPKKGILKKSNNPNYKFMLHQFTDYKTHKLYYFNENMIFGIIEKVTFKES